jgi:hypothetical protein
MGRLGFEPRTNRLKAECSTAELATPVRGSVCLVMNQTRLINIAYGLRHFATPRQKSGKFFRFAPARTQLALFQPPPDEDIESAYGVSRAVLTSPTRAASG